MNFEGFSEESIRFLVNVKKNNSKEWFLQNKPLFEKYLLKPFQNMVIDLSEFMLNIDNNFEVMPFVNKTISRIYRDTRFSKDKTLYRDSMWIVFKRKSAKNMWRDFPTFYFEISPYKYSYGMGFHCAKKETMDIFRTMIDEDNEKFLKLIKVYNNNYFMVKGDMYKKTLNPDNSDEIKNWYDRKNLFINYTSNEIRNIFTDNIVLNIIQDFKLLVPIYKFLAKIDDRKIKKIED